MVFEKLGAQLFKNPNCCGKNPVFCLSKTGMCYRLFWKNKYKSDIGIQTDHLWHHNGNRIAHKWVIQDTNDSAKSLRVISRIGRRKIPTTQLKNFPCFHSSSGLILLTSLPFVLTTKDCATNAISSKCIFNYMHFDHLQFQPRTTLTNANSTHFTRFKALRPLYFQNGSFQNNQITVFGLGR